MHVLSEVFSFWILTYPSRDRVLPRVSTAWQVRRYLPAPNLRPHRFLLYLFEKDTSVLEGEDILQQLLPKGSKSISAHSLSTQFDGEPAQLPAQLLVHNLPLPNLPSLSVRRIYSAHHLRAPKLAQSASVRPVACASARACLRLT